MIAERRNIAPGTQYNRFFGKPKGGFPHLPDGDVHHTLELMADAVRDHQHQTRAISKVLAARSIHATAAKIWNFLYNHVQYKEDPKGFEDLRTPNRLWADRKSGVDCDCYSIFISCVLHNLKIEHSFRIAAYSGDFQHVYVVIPTKHSKEIIIDPVVDRFNYEKPPTKKHDRIMIQHRLLNGIDDASTSLSIPAFGAEWKLSGLGSTASGEAAMLEATKNHLQNTLNVLAVNPQDYASVVDVEGFKAQLAYAINNWNNPTSRAAVLEELEEMDENNETAPFAVGVNGLNGFWDRIRGKSSSAKKVKELINRRRKQPNVRPATKRRGTLNINPRLRAIQREIEPKVAAIRKKHGNAINRKHSAARQTKMNCTCTSTLSGLGGLSGRFWSKVKGGLNKVKDKVKSAGSKVRNTVQNVGAKIKEAGGKILENNPISFGIRKALLYVLKNNLFQISSRLGASVVSDGTLRSQGYDMSQVFKLKTVRQKIEGIFEKIGGSKKELFDAITQGKRKVNTKQLRGLGSVAATIAAAAAPAAGIIAKITSFFKNIDFKKMLSRVKNIVPFIKEKIASGRNGESSEILSKLSMGSGTMAVPNAKPGMSFSRDAHNGGGGGSMPPNPTPGDGLVDDTTYTDNSGGNNSGGSGNNPPKEGMSTTNMLLIGGGLLAAVVVIPKLLPKKGLAGTPKVAV